MLIKINDDLIINSEHIVSAIFYSDGRGKHSVLPDDAKGRDRRLLVIKTIDGEEWGCPGEDAFEGLAEIQKIAKLQKQALLVQTGKPGIRQKETEE